MTHCHRLDFAIIGGGIADLVALLGRSIYGSAAHQGQFGGESNTRYAQGGSCCALVADDSPELHFQIPVAAVWGV